MELVDRQMLDRLSHEYLDVILTWARTRDNKTAVIVIGSAARGRDHAESDLDLLVVANSAPPHAPIGVQVTRLTRNDVRARALRGDDFVQWAIRFGRVLHGQEHWDRLKDSLLGGIPWPDPAVNLSRARDRFVDARALFDLGDCDAANEELRYALSQLARATLLSNRVYPLSRPELPGQLLEIGERALADALRRTLEDDARESDIDYALSFLPARLGDSVESAAI